MRIKKKLKRNPEDTRWHKWFAKYPVRVSEDELVWLETVYRRNSNGPYFLEEGRWEYTMNIK